MSARSQSVGWIFAAALMVGGTAPASAGGITRSWLSAELVDVALIPSSSPLRPKARLNFLHHAGDGSGRLFVNDMRGALWIVRSDGAVDATPFLDVAAILGANLDTAGLQMGLGMFAFHPDYEVAAADGQGRLYTVTSESSALATPDFVSPSGVATHHSVLSEWMIDPADPDRIDPTTQRVLMRIAEPSRNHNMGQIAFNPNATSGDPGYGTLYIATGDGGGYFTDLGPEIDPNRTAQDPGNPFGSILRIDPLGASTLDSPTNGEYGIPSDNPFVGNTEGVLEEVWAYGFRNPHRFSWDTGGDGVMIVSDIGQVTSEEVNIGLAGGNYGWSEREGTFVLDHLDEYAPQLLPEDDESFGFLYPAAQYGHDEGFAIVGGFVYRGSGMPSLAGQYVFGDIVNGRIFHAAVSDLVAVDLLTDSERAEIRELTLTVEGADTSLVEVVGSARVDLRFGTDATGEIYVLSKSDGMVRKLVPEPSLSALLAVCFLTLATLRWSARRRDTASGRAPGGPGSVRSVLPR